MADNKKLNVTCNALWWLVVAAVAVWLLWMTLRPQEQAVADLAPITAPAAARGISIPFLIGFLGNIAVFVPLGAAAALALANKPRGIRLLVSSVVGAALSAAIELLQLVVPGRVSGFADWLLNTAGTLVGAILGSICHQSNRLRRTEASA